jgi:NAD(P)-dependent dehydrogenase (short-subunit alcohol dehydrogenase family)
VSTRSPPARWAAIGSNAFCRARADAEHKPLEEVRAAAMSVQSLKRFVDPKDIAALIVFLTSDAGKSISGQVLPIDNDAQTSAL